MAKKGRKKDKDATWKPSMDKKRRRGKKAPVSENHPFKLWGKAVKEALRKSDKTNGFGVKKGTPEYKAAKEIYEKLKAEVKKDK